MEDRQHALDGVKKRFWPFWGSKCDVRNHQTSGRARACQTDEHLAALGNRQLDDLGNIL